MLPINAWTFNLLKENFSQYKMSPHYPSGSWQTSRYIQIFIPNQDDDIHYEYIINGNWEGRVELHFEGSWEDKYGVLIDKLMDQTQNYDQLNWSIWTSGFCCQLLKAIETPEDLLSSLSYIIDLFDTKIKELTSLQPAAKPIPLESKDIFQSQDTTIDISTCKLNDVLRLPLSIPNYQRIYCWEERNVKCLLDDVFSHLENSEKSNVPYCLGTIILHSHDDNL